MLLINYQYFWSYATFSYFFILCHVSMAELDFTVDYEGNPELFRPKKGLFIWRMSLTHKNQGAFWILLSTVFKTVNSQTEDKQKSMILRKFLSFSKIPNFLKFRKRFWFQLEKYSR